jgi:hypothetical protein
MNTFHKRLAQLERGRAGSGLVIVLVSGGLPGEPMEAEAGAHHWDRDPDEGLDDFVTRVKAAATEAGETLLIIGGLPREPSEAPTATTNREEARRDREP